MSSASTGNITAMLQAVRDGVPGAVQDLLQTLHSELRSLARHRRFRQGAGRAVQTTVLVNEAYLRLFRTTEPSWENRHHFFWAASRAMHDVLVEQARRNLARKRTGSRSEVPLADDLRVSEQSQELLDLSAALDRLRGFAPDLAEVVRIRFFGGLTHGQCADVMGLSEATVRRRWGLAKAWLRSFLSDDQDSPLDRIDF